MFAPPTCYPISPANVPLKSVLEPLSFGGLENVLPPGEIVIICCFHLSLIDPVIFGIIVTHDIL
ncbi:hypothetical protein Fmac_007208 [Flemingia macrophylla]|uniref:Uncharacterized protein n=1 Tax=Flemingia macrophylla TaxID=520843 RepID=A0ABD1NDB7_9FABA